MPPKKKEEDPEDNFGRFDYADGSYYEGRYSLRTPVGEPTMAVSTASSKRGSHVSISSATGSGNHIPAKNTSSQQAVAVPLSAAAGGAAGTGAPDPNAVAVNLQHGHGSYHDVTGAIYEGAWRDGKMCGVGVLSMPSGSKYSGNFYDGSYHGIGKYVWPDGSFYEGEWEANQMHGIGTYVDATEKRWRGKFYNGEGVDLREELLM